MSFDLKRRNILKAGAVTLLTGSASIVLIDQDEPKKAPKASPKSIQLEHETAVLDNLEKVKRFDQAFSQDIFLSSEKKRVFESTLKRILRVKSIIGYANFNLLSFDDMLVYAHRFPKIGRFTKPELAFIDEVFFFDANEYGFYGNKVIKELTSKINKKETIKVSGSGHYLFHGDALTKFNQLKKDLGPNLILTSGVRSIVKQLQLFLSKLKTSEGNLSLASRSLAPPGHSYHGIGDFDVGKKGYGKFNFTSKFAETKEYQRLIELKYIDLRYTKNNQVGVRYEPWHIKVV